MRGQVTKGSPDYWIRKQKANVISDITRTAADCMALVQVKNCFLLKPNIKHDKFETP
jgi:hypothetical protein